MKLHMLLLLSIIYSSLILIQPVYASNGYLYEEKITTVTRIDGETFRWEETREFLIIDYKPISINDSNFIEIQLQHSTQRGRIETIVQPYLLANFRFTEILNEDETPLEYSWKIYLFRDVSGALNNPLNDSIRNAYSNPEERVFDLESQKQFFSVNLQHFEYDIDGNKIKRYQVNTELSTKNHGDGRIEKSAIHLKKMDGNDNTFFEYNHEIQEKSILQRYLNYLDQPALFVPLQIASALFLVYLYIRGHRYWVDNDIRIIKGRGKKIIIEDVEPEEAGEIKDMED